MAVCLVVFFFFKQKTAYEMRISDWSSDVCSSDLPPADGELGFQGIGNRRSAGRGQDSIEGRRLEPAIGAVAGADIDIAVSQPPEPRLRQIGRAACRERVGPYV